MGPRFVVLAAGCAGGPLGALTPTNSGESGFDTPLTNFGNYWEATFSAQGPLEDGEASVLIAVPADILSHDGSLSHLYGGLSEMVNKHLVQCPKAGNRKYVASGETPSAVEIFHEFRSLPKRCECPLPIIDDWFT